MRSSTALGVYAYITDVFAIWSRTTTARQPGI